MEKLKNIITISWAINMLGIFINAFLSIALKNNTNAFIGLTINIINFYLINYVIVQIKKAA